MSYRQEKKSAMQAINRSDYRRRGLVAARLLVQWGVGMTAGGFLGADYMVIGGGVLLAALGQGAAWALSLD